MNCLNRPSVCLLALTLACLIPEKSAANVPGGGTNGPSVTLTDNGSTVTLANGLMSIIVTKSDASIHTINYTFNNTGSPQTLNVLSGGNNGGVLYWNGYTTASFGNMSFTESVVTNTTNYVEIALLSTTATNGIMEIHYSMLRGSPGFYTSLIVDHRSQDTATYIQLRPNIYAGSMFNWMSVDAARNRLMEVSGGASVPVQGAPKECYLWTNGIYAGQYEDKYKYSADLGAEHAWGWSSVGHGGYNVGIWNLSASSEYYPGGPMERSLMEHIGTTILNVFTGGYYGLSTDGTIQNGETWSKIYGPYFYYCNAVTNTLTGTNAAAQALYTDALAQAAAETTAWPYSWFANTNYVPAANRGTVQGKITINDTGNPNASAAGLWVGVVQQPSSAVDPIYDFQEWCRPYEFWVQADTNGNFSIPSVIAGTNYTLYAFGPGSPGTFISQNQTGGNPPLLYDLPSVPFSVTVTNSTTNNLGTITWVPARVGATVFEIGSPDRTARKFRHGDDYWLGDIGPSPSLPSPIWSKWLAYQFDFPTGVNYVVGQNRWSTDWNFIQPVVTDSQGNYNPSASTITFNLASAPANGATASLYLGFCSDYYSAIIVSVNGVNAASISGLTGSPNSSIPSTGFYATYGSSDSNIREGNNGAFFDERLTFPASALHAGQNTITLTFRETAANYFADHFMYDYIRLEMTGYIPPTPTSVIAYAGNNCNLVCWPVAPGATSYNILRSTTAGSGYASITNGVAGPVCGSGAVTGSWLDTTAANGTAYYYEVRAVNPNGSSTSSPASPATTPSAAISTSAPASPTGLSVSSATHQSVVLTWSAVSGANYYSICRSTLKNNGGGASNVLGTILLNNAITNNSYTDTTPTDGSIYSYYVTATGAGGTSGNSAAAVAVPLPSAPSTPPPSVLASFTSTTNITLTWTAVPGAIGYVISRATSASGPYTYLQTVTETTYTDYGLNPATLYYYRVAAMNDAAASANVTDAVNSQQAYPPTLAAAGTNTAVVLTWTAPAGATSYTVKRGTTVGGETTTVISGYTGLSYTNTGLVNGTTYYYVVTATGAGGTSGNSPEAGATPYVAGSGIWISAASGPWSAATNWTGNNIATGPGSAADFSTLSLPADLTVTLDSARTISSLKFGDTSSNYDWTLSGTNTLTLGTAPNIDVVNRAATISTPMAGSAGLAKSGVGTLILGGATNTVTGGVSVNTGNLTLDFTAANSPAANLLPAGNALTLSGGTLQINGSSNTISSQSFTGTTLNPGLSLVSAGGSNAPIGNLAGFTANIGGVVEFIGPATIGAGGGNIASNADLTTTASGNGAFIGGNGAPYFDALYATVGQYDFAATVGLASPYTIVGGSQIAGFYTAASGTAGTSGNLDVTGNITGWTAQPYLTSLRFNTDINGTVNVAAYSVLTLDDILVTPNVGAYNVSINNNSLRPGGGSTSYAGPYVFWQNNSAGELIVGSTLGNSKVAGATYVQAGPGTVSITGTGSGYSGQSYLNGGVTLIAGNGSIGAAASGMTVNLNGGTLAANGTFTLDNAGANLRPINLLANGGGLAATAGNTLTVDGLVSGAGTLTIGIPASAANNNTPGLLPGTGSGTANAAVYATGTVALTNANTYSGGTVIQSGTVNINGINALGGANFGSLTFNGGTLQYAANLTGNNGSSDLTSLGSGSVSLASGSNTIDLNGNAVTFSGSIGNQGSGALTVKSSLPGGSLTLLSGNNYSGNTTVSNAALLVNNTIGSATGSGNVTIQNAGTLSGNGAIAGSVTATAGGTLAVGNTADSLTIGNNLTLDPNTTTVLQIQPSPLTNSSVNVGGTITFGGTLIITNVGGVLANGDVFQLFNTPNISGNFANLVLPVLTSGLIWNTNALNAAGTLSVVALTPPDIDSISLTNDSVVITGSGGAGYWPYLVLTTTNLAAPNWIPVVTNQFDGSGNFSLQLPGVVDSSLPQMFYRLQLR